MKKLKQYIIIGFLSLFFLSACSPETVTNHEFETLKQANSGVVQATRGRYTYSITDTGIFYIGHNRANVEWTTLRYYDYEANENFVLCSSSNCQHNSLDCPAYMGDYYYIYGFTCYGGKLYYLLEESYDSQKMQFVCMDVDGTNRKVLTELEIGDYSVGSWLMTQASQIYYVNGKAVMTLSYQKVTEDGSVKEEDNGYQIIMIDLSDGSRQDVTDIMQLNIDTSGLGIKMVTEKAMSYVFFHMEEPYMAEDVFRQTYGEEASYEEYLTEYYENTKEYETNYWVDLDTGETIELQTVQVVNPFSPAVELGIYEGKILYQKLTGTEEAVEEVELYLLDPRTKEITPTIPFTEEVTDIPASDCSHKGGYMYDEGQIRIFYRDEDTYRLYIYSLADGSMKQIRDQETVDGYYMCGTTEDRIILCKDTYLDLIWLTREDYEAGAFDKATKINLLFE